MKIVFCYTGYLALNFDLLYSGFPSGDMINHENCVVLCMRFVLDFDLLYSVFLSSDLINNENCVV